MFTACWIKGFKKIIGFFVSLKVKVHTFLAACVLVCSAGEDWSSDWWPSLSAIFTSRTRARMYLWMYHFRKHWLISDHLYWWTLLLITDTSKRVYDWEPSLLRDSWWNTINLARIWPRSGIDHHYYWWFLWLTIITIHYNNWWPQWHLSLS